jgi:hypothetical protein
VTPGSTADPVHLPLEGSAQEAAWSPAGDRLAVKVSPRELVDDVLMKTRVVFVDAADGRAIGVAETPGKLGRMAWAPDGRHLGLIMAADPNDPREGRLAVVGASGGQPRDLHHPRRHQLRARRDHLAGDPPLGDRVLTRHDPHPRGPRLVSDQPVDLTTWPLFEGPGLNAARHTGVITFQSGPERVVLDFKTVKVTPEATP